VECLAIAGAISGFSFRRATSRERDSKAKKFIALYLVPGSVMADWGKTDPETKEAAEQKMQTEWRKWMGEHSKMITLTEAGGKTKRVTASGVIDVRNDIMLYSVVEAESHEAAAKAFANHPHLQILQSSIDVMEVRSIAEI
jgi:hypothetical protein